MTTNSGISQSLPVAPKVRDTHSPTSPRAHIYVRLRHGESSSEDQVQRARDYLEKHLATRFVLGETFEDKAGVGNRPLVHRPAWVRLSGTLERGDAVIIAVAATAFADTFDLAKTVE